MWSSPKKIIETRYLHSLDPITRLLQEAIAKETDPFTMARIIRNGLNDADLLRYAFEAARRMVTHLFTSSKQSWREAASEAGRGNIIYRTLRAELNDPIIRGEFYHQIQRNAEIIKTLPPDLADQVTRYIADETVKGRRAADIAREIQETFPQHSRAKAMLIARTEVSKTSTAITRARAQNMGLNWYEWRTSEDSRVRDSHRKMDHILVNWQDPPSPELLSGEKSEGYYHAGEIYNCRCYPAPVVDLELISWPHKVYRQGAIKMMTRAQFTKINQ
jgi:SPP1 gp7 family putative phage head morphogenesis protein